jgi:hypothetical protein
MVNDAKGWPELAASLYEKLTGKETEITYEFEDFELRVPSHTSENANHAQWKMNGTLKIRTLDKGD